MAVGAAEPSLAAVFALIVRRHDDDGGDEHDEAGHDTFDRLGHVDLPMSHLHSEILGDLRVEGRFGPNRLTFVTPRHKVPPNAGPDAAI